MAALIAVCKKCCLLCEILAQILGPEKVKLSMGSHNMIFPWIPPPELEEELYKELLKRLKGTQSVLTISHSRQSSGAGSEVFPLEGLDIELPLRLGAL